MEVNGNGGSSYSVAVSLTGRPETLTRRSSSKETSSPSGNGSGSTRRRSAARNRAVSSIAETGLTISWAGPVSSVRAMVWPLARREMKLTGW